MKFRALMLDKVRELERKTPMSLEGHARMTLVALLGAVMLSSMLFPVGGQAQQSVVTANDSFAAVSSSFANRFAIRDRAATIPPGIPLQAIEIIPGTLDSARSLSCDIKVYVDSSVAIELPLSGQSGAREIFGRQTHFFTANDPGSRKWQQLSEADRRYFSTYMDSFNQLAALATPDYRPGKQGSMTSIPYRNFYRDLFAGITYIHLTAPCQWIERFEEKYTGIQVWLKKRGAKDYRDPAVTDIEPEDFVKIDIPSDVLRGAKVSLIRKSERGEGKRSLTK